MLTYLSYAIYIPFLDTMVYKDEVNNLQTTLYWKPSDQQSYLHAKSEHPSALKIVSHKAKR